MLRYDKLPGSDLAKEFRQVSRRVLDYLRKPTERTH